MYFLLIIITKRLKLIPQFIYPLEKAKFFS